MKKSLAVLLGYAFALAAPVFCQGFGNGLSAPKTVTVQRLLPATVNLNGKRIRIEATAAVHTINQDVPLILKTKLVTAIQKDPRFIVDESRPETILKFTITNFYVEERHYTIGTGTNQTQCTAFTGKMEASYQALEAGTNAPLDSENLVHSMNNDDQKQDVSSSLTGLFGRVDPRARRGSCGTAGKSTQHEADDELIDSVVKQMYQRAAPSDDPIIVLLPGRKLEPLSALAISQRWNKLEEDATNFEKFPKADDDAYRLYLIALAKEAQAYELARQAAAREQGKEKQLSPQEAEESFQRAQKFLDEARKFYKDALQAKPTEKIFREPDERMEKAIEVYAKIERHKDEYAKFLAEKKASDQKVAEVRPVSGPQTLQAKLETPGAPSPAGAAAVNTAVASSDSPLEQVLTFCRDGIDVSSIGDYVKDPQFLADTKKSSYKFDIKNDPIKLKQACGDKAPAIQKMMRDRLAPAPAPKTAAAPAPAPKTAAAPAPPVKAQ
jgi:hypothetical protein